MCLNVADIDRVSKELRKTVVGTTRTEWTLAKIASEFQAFQAVDGAAFGALSLVTEYTEEKVLVGQFNLSAEKAT